MEANHDFDPMMRHLLQLLNKILSNHFLQEKPPGFEKFPDIGPYIKDKSVNVNVYFLNLAPFPEDLEDWEEGGEDGNAGDESEAGIASRLSRADLEFLRRHGIRF